MSELLARKFHDTYERLAPDFGYETRDDTKSFEPNSPNGRLMIAVCGEVAREIEAKLADVEEENKRLRTLAQKVRAFMWNEAEDFDEAQRKGRAVFAALKEAGYGPTTGDSNE